MSTILKADATGAVVLPVDLCRAAGVAPGTELVADVQETDALYSSQQEFRFGNGL